MDIALVVVSDDSSSAPARTQAQHTVSALAAARPETRFAFTASGTARSLGPGTARNRGLHRLVEDGTSHDAVLMFDDDISFADCAYQGRIFQSDGAPLLREAAAISPGSRMVLGCGYRGRQDLALLDHIGLSRLTPGAVGLAPSCERVDVSNEAPGGITGAFLFVACRANEIPAFPVGYNEDYFWLRRMARDGWDLRRSRFSLVHAPREGLEVSLAHLKFEQHGETLWCAAHDIARDPPMSELLERVRTSLSDRIAELDEARERLQQDQVQEGPRLAATALRRTAAYLRRLRRTVEAHSVIGGPVPPIAAELQQVAAYCGK
ncbi:MAG TPA: hypothetical protein VGG92_04045 [Caulobacteraceae bacterium]